MTQRIVVGISGASGAIYGVRTLEVLSAVDGIETHLVITPTARMTITAETDWNAKEIEELADHVHRPMDLGAAISSGSFRAHAMVIAPCSMKTVAGIATSFSDNLLLRAADVMLKERRRLVLLVRETPLHLGHLRLLATVTELGAVVMPPVPAFYHRPTRLEQIVDHTVNRMLDVLGIDLPTDLAPRWTGTSRCTHTPLVEGTG